MLLLMAMGRHLSESYQCLFPGLSRLMALRFKLWLTSMIALGRAIGEYERVVGARALGCEVCDVLVRLHSGLGSGKCTPYE